jgi:hypothetical protein
VCIVTLGESVIPILQGAGKKMKDAEQEMVAA